jgi:hypothetical protein
VAACERARSWPGAAAATGAVASQLLDGCAAYTTQSLLLAARGFGGVDAVWARQKLRVSARAASGRRCGLSARARHTQVAVDHLDSRDRQLFEQLQRHGSDLQDLYTHVSARAPETRERACGADEGRA